MTQYRTRTDYDGDAIEVYELIDGVISVEIDSPDGNDVVAVSAKERAALAQAIAGDLHIVIPHGEYAALQVFKRINGPKRRWYHRWSKR